MQRRGGREYSEYKDLNDEVNYLKGEIREQLYRRSYDSREYHEKIFDLKKEIATQADIIKDLQNKLNFYLNN
tara:strand:+ start:1368 stop:1583 length:216 start_codon:yes stop_codon:yes gene_type:complete